MEVVSNQLRCVLRGLSLAILNRYKENDEGFCPIMGKLGEARFVVAWFGVAWFGMGKTLNIDFLARKRRNFDKDEVKTAFCGSFKLRLPDAITKNKPINRRCETYKN